MINEKLTKIIATIGPASESEEMIEKLILAGVNIFRFNFKHNTIDWHEDRMKRVRKVAKKLDLPIGILLDLQGPALRVNMPFDDISIKKGETIAFGERVFETQEKGLSVTYPDIIKYLQPGQKILADDGTFTFYVEKKGDQFFLKSETTGILKNRKSINLPGADFPLPVLTERDREGLKLAQKERVDIIALSFVRSAKDIKEVRKIMAQHGLTAQINSKIETKMGIDNIDEIIEESDSIMVARGDLGVELPIVEVPYYQKMIIGKCLEIGKPTITATQMLQSMVSNPFPTRAEVSDVANAVYDFTDAVMLSAESATGSYPLEAVSMMRETVKFNEKKFFRDIRRMFKYKLTDQEEILSDTAYNLFLRLYMKEVALKDNITGFIVFTQSGRTARLLARYHPRVPIFTFTPNEIVRDKLTASFGVYPFLQDVLSKTGEVKRHDVVKAVEFLKNKRLVKKNDLLIVLHGDYWAVLGGTSTVKIIQVD